MTADALFDRVLTLLFSDASDKLDLTGDFLRALSMVQTECFDVENGLRTEAGSALLTAPPTITSTTQEVGYNFRLIPVMAYGIAAVLGMEDDAALAVMYRNKYEAERSAMVRGVFVEINDVYAEEADD